MIILFCVNNRRNFVLTCTRSDWCREENGRGPGPECVRTIRPLRRSSECHDISEPVPVRHSGKIGQREIDHTGRLRQPSDWSSGTHTDITPGIIDVIPSNFLFLNSEVNFHRFQVWLSPIQGFLYLIGLYKNSSFLLNSMRILKVITLSQIWFESLKSWTCYVT